MRVLVHWDDPGESELIEMYLNVDDMEATVSNDVDAFLEAADSGEVWDVVLMPTSTPDPETAFELFDKVRHLIPDSPIVGACQSSDVFRIARYMTHGLRSYVLRDDNGDFMFLLQTILSSTVEGVRAERERQVAERLREEIESVRKLQQSIIPDDLTCPEGYDVLARYESSQIRVMGGRPVVLAGGDYYDVFTIEDDSVVLLLGDASGHGMKACMSIMTMHTLVRMIHSDAYRDTASFVTEVNRRLCGQQIVNDDGGFITLLFGILNTTTHEFQWTSAGHPIPILQELETNTVRSLGGSDDGGLPLGITTAAEYDIYSTTIPPNSRLALYTDGLEEAFPAGERKHVEFGQRGIIESLENSHERDLDGSLDALFHDSNAFTKGSGRHDDTSAVMLERK